MKIDYQERKHIDRDALETLYQDAEWSAYTKDMDQLQQAVAQSYDVITAWVGNELAGLIRTVSDGLTIVYIQDILVLKKYQNLGIGSQLIQKILEKHKEVRQKVLLTEEAPDVRHFYEKNGWTSCDKVDGIAFTVL